MLLAVRVSSRASRTAARCSSCLLGRLRQRRASAAAGGFLAGKDILWYTREKKDDQEQQLRDELQAIKDREEDLMLEVGTQHLSP